MAFTNVQQCIVAGCLGTLCFAALAQQPIDAGALQKQLEREQAGPALRKIPVDTAPSRPARKADDIAVTVTAFRFTGHSLLTEAELNAAVSPYLGKPLGFADLQAAAGAVAQAYRDAGWVVRTLLPQQNLAGGVVTIEVLEARFGSAHVRASADGQLPLDPALVRDRILARQAAGSPVNAGKIERALLLLDDLPGVAAQGNLTGGSGDLETDLIVELSGTPLIHGDIHADNHGSRFTGRQRLSATVYVDNPGRAGDAISLALLRAQGVEYERAGYSLPLGLNGLIAQLNGSNLKYDVTADDFAAADLTGRATSVGLGIAYPVVRSRKANLSASIAGEEKRYRNLSAGTRTSRQEIASFSASINGDLTDPFGVSGLASASLGLTTGELGMPIQNVRHRFGKLNYALQLQRALPHGMSLRAAVRGQETNGNLDSAERFYLGGAAGVRAYPAAEAGGSEGRLLNVEMYKNLGEQLALFAFYDWGRIRVNVDNHFAGSPRVNRLSLEGAGLGLNWAPFKNTSAQLMWARRIGNNPNATLAGDDQDGTLVKDRLWLGANLYF